MKKLLLIATLSGTSLAAVAQNATVAQNTQSAQSGGEQEVALTSQLKEVVVTGTLIRGAGPTGSQLIAIGTPNIVASGVTTTSELLRRCDEFGATPQGPQVTSATAAPLLRACTACRPMPP